MRRAAATFVAICLVAAAAVAVAAAQDERVLAFTLGVSASRVAAPVEPHEVGCQQPVEVAEEFDRLVFLIGTYAEPGPELVVTVRDVDRSEPLASARLAGGYEDNTHQGVRIDGVPAGRRVAICFRAPAGERFALYGGADPAAPRTRAYVAGAPTGGDIQLTFERERSRSALSLVPQVFERAARFNIGWVGAWTFWLLLVAFGLLVPLLLLRSLRDAAD